jgi:DNA-binding MarR family transcriptional regulator
MNTNDIISLIAKIREKSNKFIIREMNNRDIKGLVTSHGDILSALFKNDVLTMKAISEKIERDKSTVTTLVDKLVNLGYVSKQKDLNDSRIILVSLTNKGKQLKSDFEAISKELIATVYKGIKEEEKEQLIKTLEKIKNNF